MLDKRFKYFSGQYICGQILKTDAPLNNVINTVFFYDTPYNEWKDDGNHETLIVLNEGVTATESLLEKLGLIKVGFGINIFWMGEEVGGKIGIKTGMTETEINNLINKQL